MIARDSSSDEILRSIAELVERGEYLDELLGAPTKTIGGGAHRGGPRGTYRKVYARGSQEFYEARQKGLIEPLPAPSPPVPVASMAEAERLVGYPPPRLLRRLYTEIGDGGYGPGYGLFSLSESVRTRQDLQRPPKAPDALVPICDWGCGIMSLIDWSGEGNQLWGLDPNLTDDIELALQPQEMTIEGWLRSWIDGELQQPLVGQDPESGEWRCATNEEAKAALGYS